VASEGLGRALDLNANGRLLFLFAAFSWTRRADDETLKQRKTDERRLTD
jgi:hypothetical protein